MSFTIRRFGSIAAAVAAVAVGVLSLLLVSAAKPAPNDVADLGVTKADSPDPVNVGATLTYTIQVTNIGPQTATGVEMIDKLPHHTDLLAATASSGGCQHKGTQVICQLGNLNDDPTKANAVTVTIQVRPTRAGTITNSATVDSAETDPIAANNKADATTKVIAPTAASCRGVAATIVGTPGADRLVGTGGPDVIAGLGGGDVILSLAGRDLVCAGGGNDSVTAGSAADRVFGNRGADRLRGRGGGDLLAGNAGRDVLKGNAGNDRLRGGSGIDRCVGGAGRDVLRSCED
jgi:uncharacterized repeat protein (TIGR01451 family)